MPFNPDVQSMSDDVEYYNQRLSEMGLVSPEAISAHHISFCSASKLPTFDIRSKKAHDRNAILFRYLNEDGQPRDVWQARMIGSFPPFDAPPAGMSREKYEAELKDEYPKYLNGREYDLYFPLIRAINPVPWMQQEHIFITEGIPKAIRACQAGIPCLSIQGKDLYFVKSLGQLVAGLERLLEHGKVKKITYIADSDGKRNADIHSSAVKLVGMLNGRRRSKEFADFAILPDLEQFDKTGLDDFLNTQGVEAFARGIGGWINSWEGSRYFHLIDALNEQIVWVNGTANYVSRKTKVVMASAAATMTVGPILATGVLANPYSNVTIKAGMATLANTFDKDPHKNIAERLDFWPGMPEWFDHGGGKIYNLYQPCSLVLEEKAGVLPAEGTIQPFLDLLEYVAPDPVSRALLLRLISHRVHYPDAKAPLAVFTYGGEGTGKTCIATGLAAAITADPNYKHIGMLNPGNTHEDNHLSKQFVCMEEPPSGISKKEVENLFKLYVDADELTCNPKGVKQYKIRNRMLFWINTNEHNAPFSGAARRWLVLKSPEKASPNLARAAWDCIKNDPQFGLRLRYYLREAYPNPVDFEIQQEASQVEAKKEMLRENEEPALTEYQDFLAELPEDLLELQMIPTRLMNMLPPYNDKSASQRSSYSKVLSKQYPLVRVGNSADGKVRITEGVNTTFRMVRGGDPIVAESGDLKELYKKWESHPKMRNLYLKKYDG